MTPFTIVILIWIMIIIIRMFSKNVEHMLYNFRMVNGGGIFGDDYLDNKAIYLKIFRQVPRTSWINELDLSKAFVHIKERYKYQIRDIFQACYFDREKGAQVFSR